MMGMSPVDSIGYIATHPRHIEYSSLLFMIPFALSLAISHPPYMDRSFLFRPTAHSPSPTPPSTVEKGPQELSSLSPRRKISSSTWAESESGSLLPTTEIARYKCVLHNSRHQELTHSLSDRIALPLHRNKSSPHFRSRQSLWQTTRYSCRNSRSFRTR